MAQGLGYFVDLAPTAFTNVASTIFQLTGAAGSPFAIQRMELQSNQTGSTQAILQLTMYIASATGSGGTTTSITPRAVVRKNTTAAATTAFDIVNGKDIIIPEIAAGQIWCLGFLTAPGTPTISGTIHIEEF